MRQEVNLYTEEFIPKTQWCSFTHAVLLSSLFIVAMGFYSFNQAKGLSALEEKNTALLEKSEGLGEGDPTDGLIDRIVEKRELLERQVSYLSSEVESKKKIKGVYETEKNVRLSSFHDVFLTIAEQSSANLSISEIGVYNGGEEIIVNGLSRTREAIPVYFNNLKRQTSFDMTGFGLLTITRIEKTGLYQFVMARKGGLKNTIKVNAQEPSVKQLGNLNQPAGS